MKYIIILLFTLSLQLISHETCKLSDVKNFSKLAYREYVDKKNSKISDLKEIIVDPNLQYISDNTKLNKEEIYQYFYLELKRQIPKINFVKSIYDVSPDIFLERNPQQWQNAELEIEGFYIEDNTSFYFVELSIDSPYLGHNLFKSGMTGYVYSIKYKNKIKSTIQKLVEELALRIYEVR